MLVAHKTSRDNKVTEFAPPNAMTARVRRAVLRRMFSADRRQIAERASDASYFSDDRNENLGDPAEQLPETDVLHLHWIADFFDYRAFFRRLPRELPVVWTLHDMSAFTGGCHYDGGCRRFESCCGSCPQLRNPSPGDLSAESWKRREKAYRYLGKDRTRIVTPSRWLAEEVKRSGLLRGWQLEVIPNGLDTEVFRPRERQAARQLFEIPSDARVVLFVADWATERRKGLDALREALRGMANEERLLVVGVGRGADLAGTGIAHKALDFLKDDLTLSLAYSAADVFVVPSRQDNLPNTILESMACGTPVAAFRTGGIPEVVREGQTGTLAELDDVAGLRRSIMNLLHHEERRKAMREECRRIAVEEYAVEVQARRYEALYKSLS